VGAAAFAPAASGTLAVDDDEELVMIDEGDSL
jgi:hypothetical protein